MAEILLAEDDDSMRSFIAHALMRAGHRVEKVADGESALKMLENRSFDLLLTDISMPHIDGITLAQQATSRWPTMRIMFITGFSAMAMQCREKYADRINLLSKPFHLRDLIKEIDKTLAF